MPLRSPFNTIAPANRAWHGSATPRSAHAGHGRGQPWAIVMARRHPEEFGLVLRLVAVMAFFGAMAALLFWFAH